ncbi:MULTISPECIES: D-alanyl-lipoteichoic acid biosynthesis protein DltD [unclassified Listeria]|uniref:D-alanyl-lipoteichoic acid biosynthesis protein DltD n=1 Tax=unclassified Listeria TaxID=2642072 RepID=UPI000B596482|nr:MULTISPECIES: D-alanyl-lipoteichoic acid biosynthesis protein DltD [unclassified Listeria]
MRKKLWMTFGPILVACGVFLFILFGPSALFGGVSNTAVQNAATSMNGNVVGGKILQQTAMNQDYMPIFGSSELSRIDPFHPSVIAKKYGTSYTPFLIGQPGTQSLFHYLDINMLSDQLKGKKVVFILSPQWFQPNGVDDAHFGATFSPIQAYTFALQEEKDTPERRFAARRLLSYKVVQNDSTLTKLLENITTPGPNKPHDSMLTRAAAEIEYRILIRKDELESKLVTGSKEKRIQEGVKKLPPVLNFDELDKMAASLGEKSTGDNPFHVKQKYFDKKISPNMAKLKDSRQNLSYASSPEYDDLQLVMDAFKNAGADVLFVNPPVNGEWLRFIGMKQEGLDEYYKKTKEQVEQNGFRYISLEDRQDSPYFLEDPIHLSWRGWVQIDDAIAKFAKQQAPTSYPETPRDFYFHKAKLPKELKKDLETKN